MYEPFGSNILYQAFYRLSRGFLKKTQQAEKSRRDFSLRRGGAVFQIHSWQSLLKKQTVWRFWLFFLAYTLFACDFIGLIYGEQSTSNRPVRAWALKWVRASARVNCRRYAAQAASQRRCIAPGWTWMSFSDASLSWTIIALHDSHALLKRWAERE